MKSPDQCRCGQAKITGHKCNNVRIQECYSCGHKYGYVNKRMPYGDIALTSEIREGQYVEYESTACPKCGCTNETN